MRYKAAFHGSKVSAVLGLWNFVCKIEALERNHSQTLSVNLRDAWDYQVFRERSGTSHEETHPDRHNSHFDFF